MARASSVAPPGAGVEGGADMTIVDLNPEHKALFACCLEDWSDEAREAGDRRACWVEQMLARGLRAKLAVPIGPGDFNAVNLESPSLLSKARSRSASTSPTTRHDPTAKRVLVVPAGGFGLPPLTPANAAPLPAVRSCRATD